MEQDQEFITVQTRYKKEKHRIKEYTESIDNLLRYVHTQDKYITLLEYRLKRQEETLLILHGKEEHFGPNSPYHAELKKVMEYFGNPHKVATLLGVSWTAVYNWVNGKSIISPKYAIRLEELSNGVISSDALLVHQFRARMPKRVKGG